MEAKHDGAGSNRPDSPSAPVELIVHNGRQKGARRPLTQPLTVIGRAPGCDLRLNVDGVGPLHCGLAHAHDGLFLRDFLGNGATLVNGQPTTGGLLRHGDIVTVGPFQFQVCFNGATPAQRMADVQARHGHERDALRIQAAAVAAQQAALGEEEARLEQRRAALQQQEEQLSGHLDEKRKRLLELRDQAKAAHEQFKKEQADHEEKVRKDSREIEDARRELAEANKKLIAERDDLAKLHNRLKRRWNRQVAEQQSAMRRREEEIAAEKRRLESDREKLQRERQALHQAQLRFNGDSELGRRQLKAEWDALRQEQTQEEERRQQQHDEARRRTRELDERQTLLSLAEQDLEDQKQQTHEMRLHLEKEAEGLENRIRNYRRKITDLEREAARLQQQAALARTASEPPGASSVAPVATESSQPPAGTEATNSEPTAAPEPVAASPAVGIAPSASEIRVEDPRVEEKLVQLEKLSGELADQRLHLLEHCQRVIEGQHRWQADRDAAAAELEELGKRLHAREQELQQRDQALEASELRQRQMHEEAATIRRHLEAWQSRLSTRETMWESDRDRLLVGVHTREKLADAKLTAITQVHQRWMRRRRREIQWLQAERTAFAKLRKECATLRQDFLKRGGILERDQRALAEQALALEEFQQELIAKSEQPAGAARRLEKLRKRWTALSATGAKALAEQRQALEKEAGELQAYHARLKQQADKIAAQEAELARQVTTWERSQMQANIEMGRMRTDLHISQTQRDRYEQQVRSLQDEVERVARLLLDETEAGSQAQTKAA